MIAGQFDDDRDDRQHDDRHERSWSLGDKDRLQHPDWISSGWERGWREPDGHDGLFDAQGKRLGQTRYGPYGEPEQTQGKTSDYRYAGMYYHASTGLYLIHYRFYDPQSGRWLNLDPIGEKGGVNLYRMY